MKLTIRIVQDETGQFVAMCPCLPGCISYGASREQAKEKLAEAIRGYIASVNNFVPANLTEQLVEA